MPQAALTRIGRYEIRGELGRGAMGTVFAAYDPNLDRLVALKVMTPLLGDHAGQRADLLDRFRLEARAAARLSHPGIVAVHDADVDEATGFSYIAMELITGRSLEDILQQRRHLSAGRTVALGVQVARALDAAHRGGLVHRDVKPGNILLAEDGTAKLSDFGIAKHGWQSLTLPGQVIGSPLYMSPEQVKGSPADGRSDLFSLGAVLYQTLGGVPPFRGDSLATIVFKVVNVEPRPLSERAPEAPPALEEIVLRCLAKDPSERFDSAAELAAALERLSAELPAAGESEGGAGLAELVEVAPMAAGAAEPAAATEIGLAGPSSLHRPQRPRRTLGLLFVAALLLAAAAVTSRWRDLQQPTVALSDTAAARPPGHSVPSTAAVDPLPEPGPPPESERDPAPTLTPSLTSGEGAEPREPDRSGTLELLFRNRLKVGVLAVWVDGELAWSGPIYGHRSFFRRAFGKETRQEIRLPPGQRTIEVRVEGRSMKMAASRVVVGHFRADQPRQLRATLNPYSETLRLDWLDGAEVAR